MKKAFVSGFVILCAACVAVGGPTTGLVAYYPFNGNANDESGTGNNGSALGGVTWTTGVVGGAAHLDGTGYISVPDSASLDLPGAKGTISAFIRVDPSSDEFGVVVKESSSSFPSTIAYEFAGRSYGTSLSMLISDGSNSELGGTLAGTLPKDSAWHHIAATWIPDDVRIYLDGVLLFQGNERVPVYTVNNTSDPVLIGAFRWNVGGMYRYLTGDMDEVRIYDRALSAEEIGQLSPIPAPGAVVLAGIGAGVVRLLQRRRIL